MKYPFLIGVMCTIFLNGCDIQDLSLSREMSRMEKSWLGSYALETVDSMPLPFQVTSDSLPVTVVSADLTLNEDRSWSMSICFPREPGNVLATRQSGCWEGVEERIEFYEYCDTSWLGPYHGDLIGQANWRETEIDLQIRWSMRTGVGYEGSFSFDRNGAPTCSASLSN